MNFGAFLGGFAQGFSLDRAMSTSEKIKKMQDEALLEVIRKDGLEQAKKDRESAVSGLITENKDEEQPKSGKVDEAYKPSTEGLPKPLMSPEVARAQEVSRTSPTANPDAAGANSAAASQPAPQLFAAPGADGSKPKGMIEMGNLDLNARTPVKTPDGKTATVMSFSIGIDGKEVLIPQVVDGKILTQEQAIQHFKQTGQHLGIFDSPEAASAYGEALHNQQEQMYAAPQNGATASAVTPPSVSVRNLTTQEQDERMPTATGKPGEPMTQAAAPEPAQSAQNQAPVPQADVPAAPAAPAPSSTQGAVASTGVATQTPEPVKIQGKFVVNGKGYATREEARKAAEKAAPSEMELFMRNGVPKIAQQYLAQGDPVKADAWTKYAESHQTQQNMKEWSSMYRAAQMGDMEAAADHMFKLYKSYEDGITPLSKETVKDKDGNITGFNVRLKNDATGAVTAQFIDRKAMIEMGLASLSPPQMFEAVWKRQAEADKATLEAKTKASERREKLTDQLTVESYKEDRADKRDQRRGQQKLSEIALTKQLDGENLGEKERAKAEGKISMLKDAGYTDEQIAGMIPAIVGAGEYKKITDPTERRALVYSDLTKNDPTFARKPKEEQDKRVQQAMDVIYGGSKPAPSSQPGPAASGAAPAPAGMPDGTVLRDKTTKELFIIKGGQRVPYDGKPAPASAAPAPAAPAPAAPAAAAPAPAAAAPTAAPPAAKGLPERPAPAAAAPAAAAPAAAAPAQPAAPAAPQKPADPVAAQIQSQSDPTLRASHMQTYANMQANVDKMAKLNEMFRKAATLGDQASVAKLREEVAVVREAIKKDRDILAGFYRVPEM